MATSLGADAADLRLAWDAVAGAAGYTLHYGTSSRSYGSQVDAGAGTSGTITGLTPGTTYYVGVVAYDDAGNRSGYSNEVRTTLPGTAPVADFTASATSGTAPISVNFTSTSTGTITSYRWSFGDGSTSTSQNPVKTYAAAGTYTVALSVTGPGGSNTKTSTGYIRVSAPGDTTAPSVPSGVAASASSSIAINVSWNASTDNVGVTGYRLERCTGSSCTSWTQIASQSGRTYTDGGRSASTTYRYRVRAVDAAGNLSGYSSIVSATTRAATDTAAPSAPASLSGRSSGNTTIDLSWSAATDNVGVTGYRVERCTGASCTSFTQMTTRTTRSWSNTGLAANTSYRYRVRAADAAGNLGPYSPIATVKTGTPPDTTAPSAPGSLAAVSGGATVINLSWNASSDDVGVTGYRLERCTGSSCTSWSQVATLTARTYADAGRNPSTTYRYRVRATDAAGNLGGYSNIASATTGAGGKATLRNRDVLTDVYASSATRSNRNGILEPGETVIVSPVWEITEGGPLAVTGTATLTGPGVDGFTLLDRTASYGTLRKGSAMDCQNATGNCYRLSISTAVRPSTRWVVVMIETLSTGQVSNTLLHIGNSFGDVAEAYATYADVEALVHHNVTLGYADGTFRPDDEVTRAQTAMFLARAVTGPDGDAAIATAGVVDGTPYDCTSGGASRFADVAPADLACRHLHLVASRGADTGFACGASGSACANEATSRAAMAVLVAGAIAPGGDAGVPVAGTFDDSGTERSYSCAGTGDSRFDDVASSAAYCRHVNYLWARGVIGGFDDGTFRPGIPVTRGQMAKFISRAFGLGLQ